MAIVNALGYCIQMVKRTWDSSTGTGGSLVPLDTNTIA